MKIIEADKKDASALAQTIMDAVGMELSESFAGEHHLDDVKRLFTSLAEMEDSQYSYRNALKAVDDDGNVMGYIIGYDGAELYSRRERFIQLAHDMLGYEFPGGLKDETGPEEFYLDSLAVYPQYRGRGVGKALILAMAQRAKSLCKPAGLLCDKTNHNARRLYDHIGFRQVGERFFAGELMDHLQLSD